MRYSTPVRRLALFSLLFIGVAAPAGQPARAPGLIALNGLEKGLWILRERRDDPAPKRVCVSDPAALMQVQHGGSACSRYVIDNQAMSATVHYTCPGAGHGRTTLRVETSRIIRLDSQGIANNAPFDFSYEGRYSGPCR